MYLLQSQMTLNSWDESADNNELDYYTSKDFRVESKSDCDISECETTLILNQSTVLSCDSLSCSTFNERKKSISFLDKGIFTRLFYDEETFKNFSFRNSGHQQYVEFRKRSIRQAFQSNSQKCFNRFMLYCKNHISIECLDINNKDISIIRKQYQKFMKKVSYTEMIFRIIKSERYSKFFYYYLQDFFLDDLYTGNFKQLRDHFISSIYFLACSSDPSLLDNIKFHKK